MRFRNIRAVLFDLDGTLVRTEIDFARMKREVLEQVAAAGLSPEEYESLDILGILHAAAPRLPDPGAFLAQGEAALVAIELEASGTSRPIRGAEATLRWLIGRGIRVGIVTRNSPQAVARLLKRHRLPHHCLLTRADTPRVKPDPLHLHLALERLGAAAEAAVMVGDHVMDVIGGRAAGTHTLGFLAEGRADGYFDRVEPDGVIRSLPELRQWISP